MADTPPKPVPAPDTANRPFFEGSARGKLVLQRCRACGAWRFPARARCDVCRSGEAEWAETSGNATLVSHARVHQKYHPAFEAELPYPIAIVELSEGPRLLTNLVEIEGVPLKLGMALEVVFAEAGEGIWIPKFRPMKN